MTNNPSQNTTTKKQSTSKPAACFTVSQGAIKALLENKANTIQICTYLTLARSRRKDCSTSSTGISAITDRVGIGKVTAEKTLAELKEMHLGENKLISQLPDKYTLRLIQLEDTYNKFYDRFAEGEYEADVQSLERFRNIKPQDARWHLGNSGSSVWFPDSLVGSKRNQTNKNLKKLKNNRNDIATRLLLLMYQCNNLELDAVWPGHICHINKLDSVGRKGNYDIYQGVMNKTVSTSKRLSESVLSEGTEELYKSIQTALLDLERMGFVSRVLYMVTYSRGSNTPPAFYEVDIKDEFTRKDCCHRLDLKIRDVAAKCGVVSSRNDKRSFGKYILIAPTGLGVSFVTGYRLRYRLEDPKNYYVKCGIDSRASRQQELLDWIKDFESSLA